jgi:hypothetical protein
MHFHLPKPLHGWREFAGEVGIIVIGVLIALGAEQVVESILWRHKVEQAEVRLRADLTDDTSFASQYEILTPCANAYLDRMQTDLLKHDSADMGRLYQLGPPFVGEPWKVVAWENATASQIGDHMSTERFQVYEEAFRGADLLRDFNLRNRNDYAAAMTGRFALPADTKTTADELAAVERLRTYITIGRNIAKNDLINRSAHVGVTLTPDVVDFYRKQAAKCTALLGPARSR